MITVESFSLKGKTALITGAGSGIGFGIAETFANFGANLLLVENDEQKIEQAKNKLAHFEQEILICHADATERKGAEQVRQELLDTFGGIDILVNNLGGILGTVKPFLDFEDEEWDALYAVNLRHIFLYTKLFAPLMIEAGKGGSIINISSIEAFRAIPTCAVYGAFKSAISGFVRSMAMEFAPFKIRVNAIAPETTQTPSIDPEQFTAPEHMELWDIWNPLGRFGKLDDIAGCALYLASALSPWVTGSTVHVDGGALAAAGWYRMPGEKQRWTLAPVIKESGFLF